MKYGGGVYSGIHHIAATFRAGLLSLPAIFKRSDGSEYTVFISPEPIDSLTANGVLSLDGEQMLTRYKLFTVVLEGQEIDFVSDKPSQGDVIEIEINSINETWYVTKSQAASCWGFVNGNEKIWILASKYDPRKS